MANRVSPSSVRYIKLGEGGQYERDCIERGVNRIGFGTVKPERFELCAGRRWDELYGSFIAEGKVKGTARAFTTQVRTFFEDDGAILWITFHAGKLYWGSVGGAPMPSAEFQGAIRLMQNGCWRSTDLKGQSLLKDSLSGKLTKVEGFRGTSCEVTEARDYVIRRINGEKLKEVQTAIDKRADLEKAAIGVIRLLTPKDFELLVDLIFSTSGWRRVGVVGGPQETVDVHLTLPSTGEDAYVQVKSEATQEVLEDYLARLEERRGVFQRMFFVYHTGDIHLPEGERPVTIVGPEELPKMVIEAGLIGWLIDKAS